MLKALRVTAEQVKNIWELADIYSPLRHNSQWKKVMAGLSFFDAKNTDLVKHYSKALGAQLLGVPHPYRMILDEDAARKLLKLYTFGKE